MEFDPTPIGESRRPGFALGLIALLLVCLAPLGAWLWLHNGLIAQREAVDAAWAQIESNYQRRADLVPALVDTVQRYMRHESETLAQVVSDRSAGLERFSLAAHELSEAQQGSSRALEALAGAAPGTESDLAQVAGAQAEVGRSIRQVLALAESYPTLRAADHFLELQAQLEGTENRINVARMGYNEAVRDFNAACAKVPTSYIAEARGYERRAYFKTNEVARHAAPLGFE